MILLCLACRLAMPFERWKMEEEEKAWERREKTKSVLNVLI